MPCSRADNIPIVIEEVIRLNPKSILDVGIGFGMWGVLFRAYTDVRLSEIEPDRYKHPTVEIHGIECFEGYRNCNYNNYDLIYESDAIAQLGVFVSRYYDLIYLGDIIEHFTKEDGLELLNLCYKVGKNVIVSTPRYFREQTAVLGNEHEKHLSFWEDKDFPQGSRIVNTKYQKVIIINDTNNITV